MKKRHTKLHSGHACASETMAGERASSWGIGNSSRLDAGMKLLAVALCIILVCHIYASLCVLKNRPCLLNSIDFFSVQAIATARIQVAQGTLVRAS